MSLTADSNFVFPPDFHVTLAFFGGASSPYLTCPLIKEGLFKENASATVTLRAYIIVPNKILTAVVSTAGVTSTNDFPHITLMRGEWKPVQSNNILKALFNEKYGLKRDRYKAIMDGTHEAGYTEKMLVNMQREGEVECYLVVPGKQEVVQGVMKSYYNNA